TNGLKEINNENYQPKHQSRCRKKGAGRKQIQTKTPNITQELNELLQPHTKKDPENPLKWTSKSTRNLETALKEKGYKNSDTTIANILKKQNYSLQTNKKAFTLTPNHPDRNAQFEYINKTTQQYMKTNQPTISIDAKKKEHIDNFKNSGTEYTKKHEPVKVLEHDFPIKELGRATPYGVYDIMKNAGFVNVGLSNDTAEFAVTSIKKWWYEMGREAYPDARSIYITADSGGSNGVRVRLWKIKLQELADELGLVLRVSHFPAGTSKWNKIEHRLFSFISKSWHGRSLVSLVVIVSLIGATTTEAGLRVRCVVDSGEYEKGVEVSDEELARVNLCKDDFHGEWNYSILPNKLTA
ncbi:MAG: ISAzo13 family transposase, partial [Candidatus Bathyarchaeota archaeon]|nr:ISAzo13 family transposase [Candidatus Termiticorpusculum sp.]